MGVVVRRFDVFLIALDPTIGREIRKTRPCLVLSPDEMNRHLATILVAPMTTGGLPYPTRVPCRFRGKDGRVALDQIRAVDRSRLVRRLGRIAASAQEEVISTLGDLFAK
jgi:mRNA interferase MazF